MLFFRIVYNDLLTKFDETRNLPLKYYFLLEYTRTHFARIQMKYFSLTNSVPLQ